jgi:cell division protein FtsB
LPIPYCETVPSIKLELRAHFKQEGTMPRQKTREELQDRIDELEAENETLQDQVDSIAEIIEPEEDDDDGED